MKSALAAPVTIAPGVLLYARGSSPPKNPEGDLSLPVIPSSAFGDGSHPTTRLCAQAVDLWCRTRSPRAVLDVGTGTGVLARIARARGVPFVVGTDNDPVALEVARANAALDRSPGELVVVDRSPESWGPRFELIVANILEGVLLELGDALAAALAPEGRLLISGFTRLQAPRLRAALGARPLVFDLQVEREEWVLQRFSRPAPGASRGRRA